MGGIGSGSIIWYWYLTIGVDLKFYSSVAKGLRLKVRMFWGLIPRFEKIAVEKMEGTGGGFALRPHSSSVWLIIREIFVNKILKDKALVMSYL